MVNQLFRNLFLGDPLSRVTNYESLEEPPPALGDDRLIIMWNLGNFPFSITDMKFNETVVQVKKSIF